MTGVILAGGHSTRMQGTDKAFLRRDGRRVIERNADLLREVCTACAIVARDGTNASQLKLPGWPMLVDKIPGCGPLGGLAAAFDAINDDLFVLACDLPHLEAPLLKRMVEIFAAEKPRVLLPRTRDGDEWRLQPLCAIWSKDCAPDISQALSEKRLALFRLIQSWPNVRTLDLSETESAWLKNVNTPGDL
jgi:molybdenum cofactor guanylyltransferase